MLVDAARRPGGGHCVQAQFLAGDAVQRQRQRLVLRMRPPGTNQAPWAGGLLRSPVR